MKPANFNITRPEHVDAWRESAGAPRTANDLALCVVNDWNIYRSYSWLLNCCLKQFRKFGGLDLDYLRDSSHLKAITREARKRYGGDMEDDREARGFLAGHVLEEVAARAEA